MAVVSLLLVHRLASKVDELEDSIEMGDERYFLPEVGSSRRNSHKTINESRTIQSKRKFGKEELKVSKFNQRLAMALKNR